MSGKRPSLAESMRAVAAEAPLPSAEQLPAADVSAKPKAFYAATRAGKKKATATLSEAAHRQLKTLAATRGRTVEELLTEAINDLFRKYGQPSIA
jgi:hypothetical protein